MSKSLYAIAFISLLCWVVGLLAFPAEGLIYFFVFSGSIALLFAVVCNTAELMAHKH